ncbi:Glycosyl transferases group 1 family protein [Clavispora lusitaniae]|uniref:Glycosyl transferases group 1 family protein n=1 Tax=Clavispora lusitaniae TaxID=36911 RepID=UPI00202C1691|nr:Glycosyl transferases group 1 family protein [Clavispora lusitaniae]
MAKIAFVHPDLGIGGAERLVVDAAVGLQERGHHVTIYTSHCDMSHCFDEISSGVLAVKVFGDFLPTTILGKFHILCAILRQLYLVLRLILSGEIRAYDFFIVDQLSFCVPLLNAFSTAAARVLFYCHFPDQLLAKKGGAVKKLYRVPFDAVEEWSTGTSDQIVVNSTFTKSIFHSTFTHLSAVDPGVIYPCVDVLQPQQDNASAEQEWAQFMGQSRYFLSINRFERLKNVALAIRAYAKLEKSARPRLVIAGGFDARVRENVEYLAELEKLCDSLGLVHYTFRGKLVAMPKSTEVVFLPSVKNSVKNAALKSALLLLYTPTFEHFGIVPVESMLHKTPVLAIDRGGPLESIVNFTGENLDSATGFNRPNDIDAWAEVLSEFSQSSKDNVRTKLGENGWHRANELFSRDQMSEQFEANLLTAAKAPKKSFSVWPFAAATVVLVGMILSLWH